MLRLSLVLLVVVLVDANQKRSGLFGFMAGRSYDVTDEEAQTSWKGSGREFDLFDTRTKDDSVLNDDKVVDHNNDLDDGLFKAMPATKVVHNNNNVYDDDDDDDYGDSLFKTVPASATRSPSRREYYGSSSRGKSTPTFLHNVQEWWSTNLPNFPQLKCRLEPTTTLKIRKTFRPLKTIVRLGADFNTQLGVWQFKSSWEDAIIGGKLTLAGRELQLTKSWQLSMGPMEDLVTRLRFRAAVDLQTMKAYARVGFRTERLSPINVMEGFTIQHQIPLDGHRGHIKLGVKAKVALPEPEIQYSTENSRSLNGMGDIEVNVEELNLLLDY